MKHAFCAALFVLSLGLLAAQTISNARQEQNAELRYYTITFDLSGAAEDSYIIKVVPFKEGQELSSIRYASGQGISDPCGAGKGLQVFWNPLLEGVDSDGWQFRLSSSPIPKNMVLIEDGNFQMGSPGGGSDEKPVHNVAVSSFYLGKYEVTQKEWTEVMGSNPSMWKGDKLPVENVSWYDAVDYCNKRSVKEGLTPCYSDSGASISCNWSANGYRLPTEAEWEYAARGGSNGKGYEYAGSDNLDSVGWYDSNSGSQTHPVGGKSPNELGLYDMSGNVWEWCWDSYASDYYKASASSDPRGPGSGSSRVLRGGSWFDLAVSCRVAYRSNYFPDGRSYDLGLRLARAK